MSVLFGKTSDAPILVTAAKDNRFGYYCQLIYIPRYIQIYIKFDISLMSDITCFYLV